MALGKNWQVAGQAAVDRRLAMAQLALYKGKGRIGNAMIRVWTGSVYSHCELVIDGVAYSSSLMDGGVRSKRIAFRDDHWDMLDLPQRFDAAILAHFDATRGSRYSWLDLIRSQIFNTGANEVGASFCSEWCAEALGLPNGTIFSPRTLGELIRVLLATPWAQPAATQSHT